MAFREIYNLVNESVRIFPTEHVWTPEQAHTIASDESIPSAPTLAATAADQAIDLVITPPTTNTDGTSIIDLQGGGFVVYYSTSSGIDVDNPATYSGTLSLAITNTTVPTRKTFPTSAKHYFVATVVDRWSNPSAGSSEVNATPTSSGYAPSVVDYGNNIEQVYEGCGIIALKLQPPKSDWEKGGGYIVYFDEKTSGGSWPSPATWTYLYHGVGPIVLHKQLEADSGSGNFRLYKYKVRVFAQGADLTNVTDDSQLSLDNTSGEVTTGTIDDGVASGGYDPSQADNAALIAETVIAEKFLGNEFVGQTFAGGIFRSTNWGTSAGSEFDASAGTLRLGGSSSPKFSVAATGVMTATEGNFSGAVTSSSVTITGGTLNINSGVFSVSAAGAVVASSISCTNLVVGAGSTWGGNTLATAKIPNLDCDKITSGTFGTVRIPNLSCDKITSGTFGTVRIPNLSCDKITSGTFGVVRIPDLAFSKIIAGTNTASLTIGSGGYIASSNYSAGSAGFKINGAGDAEFNTVTVRGALIAQSGSSISGTYLNNINATTITTGIITGITFRTATSGERVQISPHTLQIIGASAPTLRLEMNVDGLFARYMGGWNASSMCALRYTTGRFSYSGATVYGPTAKGTSWENLNLSSIVGARRALVLLRVYNTSGVNKNYQFRIDGSGIEQGQHAEDFPGAFSCRCTTAQPYNYVWVMTGTNGYIEWRTTVVGITTVVLLAYIS